MATAITRTMHDEVILARLIAASAAGLAEALATSPPVDEIAADGVLRQLRYAADIIDRVKRLLRDATGGLSDVG